ncbi:MAG: hypothetical protein LBL92_01375, partial [Propionibacteriaceae bacterium]|nr:hypothetical protein [Propionibacteriaceae bacterium]
MSFSSYPDTDRVSREDWVFDTVLAILGVCFVLAPYLVVIAFYGPDTSGRDLVLASIIGLLLCASIIIRRHYPLPFMGIVAVLCLVHVIVVPLPFTLLLVIPLAIYTLARYSPTSVVWTLFFWVPAAIAATLRWFWSYTADNALRSVAWVGGFALVGVIVAAYTIGRRGHDLVVAQAAAVEAALSQQQWDAQEADLDRQASVAAIQADTAAGLYDAFADTIAHMVSQADQAQALLAAQQGPQAAARVEQVAATGRDLLADLEETVDGQLPWSDGLIDEFPDETGAAVVAADPVLETDYDEDYSLDDFADDGAWDLAATDDFAGAAPADADGEADWDYGVAGDDEMFGEGADLTASDGLMNEADAYAEDDAYADVLDSDEAEADELATGDDDWDDWDLAEGEADGVADVADVATDGDAEFDADDDY